MDIDALHSALLSITVVSEKIRAAREMLSATGDAPAQLGKFLREAENDLRMAQATLGGELGFNLCPRCWPRSEEHTSELQSRGHLVCRLLLEKKKKNSR